MSEEVLILASGLVLVYGMFSQLLERSVVTPPMAFMARSSWVFSVSGCSGPTETDVK